MSIASQQAELQRAEAKALLGLFITDQGVADRIVDCIVGTAMLEIAAMMCDEAAALERKEGEA